MAMEEWKGLEDIPIEFQKNALTPSGSLQWRRAALLGGIEW